MTDKIDGPKPSYDFNDDCWFNPSNDTPKRDWIKYTPERKGPEAKEIFSEQPTPDTHDFDTKASPDTPKSDTYPAPTTPDCVSQPAPDSYGSGVVQMFVGAAVVMGLLFLVSVATGDTSGGNHSAYDQDRYENMRMDR